jgi:pilus assembly protein Flp/PilA
MKNLLKRLWKEESGQDLTEYALLLVLIALVCITAITGLSTAIAGLYGKATNSINLQNP